MHKVRQKTMDIACNLICRNTLILRGNPGDHLLHRVATIAKFIEQCPDGIEILKISGIRIKKVRAAFFPTKDDLRMMNESGSLLHRIISRHDGLLCSQVLIYHIP